MNFAKTTIALAAATATMLGAVTLPAAAQGYRHHHYSAAQRQAYAAGYRHGFNRGQMAVADAGQPGLAEGRSVAIGAPVVQPGVYGGPFNNGGVLGTGLFSGGGVLGTGVFGGQGALGLGVLGF